MITKSQKIRLGIFTGVAFVLLLLLIGLIIGNKVLKKRDIYYIAYTDRSVSGLDIGSAVKYHGIRIGQVDNLAIDAADITRIIVTISVTAGTPIKEDVRAEIGTVGITGLKLIELVGGSVQSQLLQPASFIQPGEAFFEAITGKAEIIAEKLEAVLNNLAALTNEKNREHITHTIQTIDSLVATNQSHFDHIMVNLDSTSTYLTTTLSMTANTMQRINTLLSSSKIDSILTQTQSFTRDLSAVNLTEIATQLSACITTLNDAINHVDLTVLKGRDDLLETLETLRETMEYLNEFSRQISEEPSLLLRGKKK